MNLITAVSGSYTSFPVSVRLCSARLYEPSIFDETKQLFILIFIATMKKIYSLAIGFLFAAFITGCNHNDSLQVNPSNTSGPASGNWVITYLMDDGIDMSHHLDGYTFNFKSNGGLDVATGVTTINGTWVTGTDDSKPKMTITLPGADPMLAELAEDWIIQVNTATELNLLKDGGHPREVHFIKQ